MSLFLQRSINMSLLRSEITPLPATAYSPGLRPRIRKSQTCLASGKSQTCRASEWQSHHYFIPTIMIVNEPGMARPRPIPPGLPAGGDGSGAASDAIANRCPVLLSKAIVRAPFEGHVFKFCSTSNFVGLFSLMIVIVPLP